MRLLGYQDAYLGFLASRAERARRGNRVLDVGCGSGTFADAWAAIHGPDQDITLLDPSGQMLRRADEALRRRGIVPALEERKLEAFAGKNSFDTILAAHVIEHSKDPAETLHHMRETSAPGGWLWLVVSKPHWCNAIVWLQWRHRSYAPDAVEELLDQCGWQLETQYVFPSGPPSRTSRGYLAHAI